MTVFAATINTTAVVVFAVILAVTLGITYWASKRAGSTAQFYAAGRGITGTQNGLAISGDYLSAASFLGIAGLIYLYGFVPLREYRQRVSDEIAEGREQLSRSARILGSADSMRAERGELEKRLKQTRTHLLPGRGGTLGAAALQERTNSLAAEKGITVQSTQGMKEEALDPYRKVSVRLTLSGELKPFAELMSGLEYDQQLAIPFVEANRRGAVPGAKGPRTIQATVEVTGFVLGEEAKGEAVGVSTSTRLSWRECSLRSSSPSEGRSSTSRRHSR